ncbi:hypothetical protein B0H13DRAFT_1928244 [Mycena leptocephala]|nr:hypothetical protein B0H13DRAFT_1928244 [Mycena leptocephala]
MAGYEKPRLQPSSPGRFHELSAIIFRLFLTILISFGFGCSLPFCLQERDQLNTWYLALYVSAFLTVWLGTLDSDAESDDCDCLTPQEKSKAVIGGCKPPIISYGLASRLRGGGDTSDSSSEADSDAPKRKRKGNKPVLPRKRSSNSGSKAPDMGSDSDSEHGIRVTAKSKKRRGGLLVDEIIHLDSAPESWDIPASTNRVAYILDLTDTPELLGPLTLDAYVKKQCQDAWTGPTGSAVKNLAKVVLFDPEAPPRWDDMDEPHENISAPIRAAKVAESESVAATASAYILFLFQSMSLTSFSSSRFYRSAQMVNCKGKFLDSTAVCGGRAILRKFRDGPQKGKTYFVGCSNWADGDSDTLSKIHRFTAIPSGVRESILVKLIKGEPINEEDNDTDVLAGSCCHIIHPSHLPQNSRCPRNHFQDGVHVVAKLQKHFCSAKLSILVPTDGSLRAVVIPGPGLPHAHPSFPRTKIPAVVVQNALILMTFFGYDSGVENRVKSRSGK